MISSVLNIATQKIRHDYLDHPGYDHIYHGPMREKLLAVCDTLDELSSLLIHHPDGERQCQLYEN